MPGIFLAPTTVAAPAAVSLQDNWPGLAGMTYQADGDDFLWDLLGDSGVLLMADGCRGLAMPPVDRYTDESPAVDGSRWRGMRVKEREAFWPLFVYHDGSSQEWVEHDRAFWQSLEPDRVGTWTVTHPDGKTVRRLRVRFTDDGDPAFDIDPARAGWAVYGVRMVAEEPYWLGAPMRKQWTSATMVDFFNDSSKAPPFRISSGAAIGSATMSNPGRVPAWPTWTIDGPTTSVDLGLSDQLIEVPFTIPSGQSLVVDTDPTAQTAMLYSAPGGVIDFGSAVERTGDLGATNFAPIPKGTAVELSLAMVGTGAVAAEITPRYYRAW